MARTSRDVVDYFPHDSHASDGDTLTVLQSRFGNNGYAFWFKLLEKLSATEGHCLDCSTPVKWQLLLAKTGVNEITGVEIVNLLVEMQAIDKELWQSKLIWCQKLVNNVAEVYKNRKRQIPQKPLNIVEKPISTVETPISTPEIPQSKVKYSRVDNSKVDKDIELPEWLEKDVWASFLEMRKSMKASPTFRAKELLIKELERFKSAGDNPNEILNQSIMNNWKSVFALKKNSGGQNGQSTPYRGNPSQKPAGAFSGLE